VSDKDTALRIFCALLARDPLPAQRFQDINQRFRYLAAISWAAGRQFEAAQADNQAALEIAWDKAAEREVKKNPGDQAREHALISNAREDEHKIPKSQRDFLDQIGSTSGAGR
jgi:hypothetical protein